MTNSFDSTVLMVDLAGLSVVATIPVGNEHNGISASPKPLATMGANSTALTILAPPANGQSGTPHSGHGHQG
ncbi:MAG TPA: hypothetical protein PKK01_03105 [Mycobacterium sp.]|nr:hypothetical protein [Mycobacterium sp.]HPZ95689.1 hypothetical protein [Mycobacterium sp.]HQE14928.1 hypothetical protein [Mycobacterium sp.]